MLGDRRMSLSPWDEGSDSDHVTGMNWNSRLVGHRKILAWQWAELPRYGRQGEQAKSSSNRRFDRTNMYLKAGFKVHRQLERFAIVRKQL